MVGLGVAVEVRVAVGVERAGSGDGLSVTVGGSVGVVWVGAGSVGSAANVGSIGGTVWAQPTRVNRARRTMGGLRCISTNLTNRRASSYGVTESEKRRYARRFAQKPLLD